MEKVAVRGGRAKMLLLLVGLLGCCFSETRADGVVSMLSGVASLSGPQATTLGLAVGVGGFALYKAGRSIRRANPRFFAIMGTLSMTCCGIGVCRFVRSWMDLNREWDIATTSVCCTIGGLYALGVLLDRNVQVACPPRRHAKYVGEFPKYFKFIAEYARGGVLYNEYRQRNLSLKRSVLLCGSKGVGKRTMIESFVREHDRIDCYCFSAEQMIEANMQAFFIDQEKEVGQSNNRCGLVFIEGLEEVFPRALSQWKAPARVEELGDLVERADQEAYEHRVQLFVGGIKNLMRGGDKEVIVIGSTHAIDQLDPRIVSAMEEQIEVLPVAGDQKRDVFKKILKSRFPEWSIEAGSDDDRRINAILDALPKPMSSNDFAAQISKIVEGMLESQKVPKPVDVLQNVVREIQERDNKRRAAVGLLNRKDGDGPRCVPMGS